MSLTGAFDLDTARALCAACAQTYAGACDVQTPLAHANVLRLEGRAAAAGPVASPQTVMSQPYSIVAFRGSKSLQDWITDFEFRQIAVGGNNKVHEGFWKALNNIQPQIAQRVDKNVPVIVTGHSLGGAMALLSAQWLFNNSFTVAAVYTFGGPRVGNDLWALGYDLPLKARTWRLVDELDVVPRIPFLGYTHVGNRVQLGDNQALINPPWPQVVFGDALQMWRAWNQRRIAQLMDHPVEAYERRLAALNSTEIF